MNKENVLFGIIGILLGIIIGFMFANSVNRGNYSPTSGMQNSMSANSNMPAGHPDISGQQPTVAMPDIQASIDKAKQNPNDFEAQIKVAELYYQAEKYEQATEYLRAANKIKPEHYETIVNLGNSTFDAGNFAEAEKWYSSALSKKADDVNVRSDLGLTFVFRDPPNYDRAIEEFNRALEVSPNNPQALRNLVFVYTRKGDATKAGELLAKLESIDPTNSGIPKLREEIQKIGQ